jgi:hypothetical protein
MKKILTLLLCIGVSISSFSKEGTFSKTGSPQDEASCGMMDPRVRFSNPKCKTPPKATEVSIEYSLTLSLNYNRDNPILSQPHQNKVDYCVNSENVKPLISYIKNNKLDAEVRFVGYNCDINYIIKDKKTLCEHILAHVLEPRGLIPKNSTLPYSASNFTIVRVMSDGNKYRSKGDARETCSDYPPYKN